MRPRLDAIGASAEHDSERERSASASPRPSRAARGLRDESRRRWLLSAVLVFVAQQSGSLRFFFSGRFVWPCLHCRSAVHPSSIAAMKRLVAGTLTLCSLVMPCARASAQTSDGFLARYMPNGALDTSFSGDGIVTTGNAAWDTISSARVLSDGSVLVAVNLADVSQNQAAFVIARYTANGTSDTTFGFGGVTTFTTSPPSSVTDIGTDLNGRILATLWENTTSTLRMVRFNANGTLDNSFSVLPLVVAPPFGAYPVSTSVNPLGSGATVGVRVEGATSHDFKVLRFQSNGSLDTSFNGSGVQTLVGAGDLGAIMVDVLGKTWLAGNTVPNTESHFVMRALTSSGAVDNSFSFATPFVSLVNPFSFLQGAARDSNGFFLTAGGTIDQNGVGSFLIARNLPNGGIDALFNATGYVTAQFTGSTSAQALAVVPVLSGSQSGKIVVPGIAYDFGAMRGRLAMVRYTSAGALDTSFDGDGKVLTDFGSGRVWSCGARIADSTGKILVYGSLMFP